MHYKSGVIPKNCVANNVLFGWFFFNNLEREKADKTFGFSFVSLMRADGTTVPDDTHDLCVYKVTVTFMFKHLAHSL